MLPGRGSGGESGTEFADAGSSPGRLVVEVQQRVSDHLKQVLDGEGQLFPGSSDGLAFLGRRSLAGTGGKGYLLLP